MANNKPIFGLKHGQVAPNSGQYHIIDPCGGAILSGLYTQIPFLRRPPNREVAIGS